MIMPIRLICAVIEAFYWDVNITPLDRYDNGTWELKVVDTATGLKEARVYASPDEESSFGYYITYYKLWEGRET